MAVYSKKILPSTFAKINSLLGSFAFHAMRTGALGAGESMSLQEAQRTLARLRAELEIEFQNSRKSLAQTKAMKPARDGSRKESITRKLEQPQGVTSRPVIRSPMRVLIHTFFRDHSRRQRMKEILKLLEDTNPQD